MFLISIYLLLFKLNGAVTIIYTSILHRHIIYDYHIIIMFLSRVFNIICLLELKSDRHLR